MAADNSASPTFSCFLSWSKCDLVYYAGHGSAGPTPEPATLTANKTVVNLNTWRHEHTPAQEISAPDAIEQMRQIGANQGEAAALRYSVLLAHDWGIYLSRVYGKDAVARFAEQFLNSANFEC